MLYTIVGLLLLGHATTMYDGPFSVGSTVQVIAERAVTNLAAAPTAHRMLMAAGETAMEPIAGRLRVASNGGELLNPEVARWAERVLRCRFMTITARPNWRGWSTIITVCATL
jgi:acetyl-CoA synthetase